MPGAGSVRDAVPADAATIAAVHARSWVDAYGVHTAADGSVSPSVAGRAGTWRDRILEQGHGEGVLVVEVVDGVGGFVWIGPSTDPDDDPTDVGQIRSLHVAPRQQGHGLGTLLLHAARDRLASSGYHHSTLWVVEDNVSARTFYERRGWVHDGTRREEQLAMPGEPGPAVTVVRYRSTDPAARGGD